MRYAIDHCAKALAGLVILTLAAGALSAQTLLVDDFGDGDADGWTREDNSQGQPFGPGIFDASSGAFVLENSGTVPAGTPLAILISTWERSSDPQFSNGFLRGKITVGTEETVAGFTMRSSGPGSTYVFLVNPRVDADAEFTVEVARDFAIIRSEAFTIPGFDVLPEEDWLMQAGAIGNELSLKAWRADQPEPEAPQLTFTDNTFSDGMFGVTATMWLANPTPGKASATFDDIFFTAIPEPSTILGAWLVLPLACHFSRTRARSLRTGG